MSEPLSTEPTELRAGDSVSWTRNLPEYLPADGWALKYRLLWPAPPHKDIAATASGALHLVQLGGATTAAYPAGQATLVGWVEQAGSRITLLQQQVTVLADLTAATSLDGRTDNQRSLAQAKAALAAYVAGGNAMTEEYEIAGRRLRFRSIKDLQDLVSHYERAVAKDNSLAALAQGVVPGRIYTRF